MEKVRQRFALKRELQDLAALGVPLDRAERRLLGVREGERGGKRPHTSPTVVDRCSRPLNPDCHKHPSAAEWLNRERPSTTASTTRGIAQLLDGKLLPETVQTIAFLRPGTRSKCRSEVRFALDMRALPATMPARAWQSVEPLMSSDLLSTSQFPAPGPASSVEMQPSQPRSVSVPARPKHRRCSPSTPGKPAPASYNLKARPFPRTPTPEHPGHPLRAVDHCASSGMWAVQEPAASNHNMHRGTPTTPTSYQVPQSLDGIVEERSGAPKQEIGASLSTLIDSHDELSAASQTLMRRANQLLQQPGGHGEVGSGGNQGPCLNDRLMPDLPRQVHELTKDERHLLSDMISVL